MDSELQASLSETFGAITGTHPLAGGDINDAFKVCLADSGPIFVKTHRHPPPGLYGAEARGLAWLAEAETLRTPKVLGYSDDPQAPYLALDFETSAPRGPAFDENLGQGLAKLHRRGPATFGLDHDNFIGPLPQSNTTRPTWPEFYRECRLQPQIERASSGGLLPLSLQRKLGRLLARLESLVGDPEPPARLHGDLWNGNLHVDHQGKPMLIDPAAYGGHREMDLAMMRLFGGFGPGVFASYREAHPLRPGHADRISLYQLYPLLVHLNLFGTGYVGAVDAAASRYG